MRRFPLALTTVLTSGLTSGLTAAVVLPGCGDDGPTQTPTGSSSDTTESPADSTTSPEPGTTTEADTTTDASTTSVDSTGPASECGNGMIEGVEQCDDGNLLEDDACYSNCTIPYEELWTVTYDGGEVDNATGAVFDAAGNLYVFGSTQLDGQDYDLWLRQYTPDGREGFTWTYDGALGGDDFGRDLAWHDSGDLILVGSETTETGDDVLVIRFDHAAQAPVWVQRYDGPGSGPGASDDADFANDVATAPDGSVLVAATERVDGQEFDMWLRKYDADGNEIWTRTFDGAINGSDSPDAVLVDADGNVYLVGNTEIAGNDSESWIRKHDADGNEIWTQTVPGVIFNDGALDAQGNLVLVGLDVDNTANVNMWAGKFDPDFAPLGSTEYDGPSGSYDSARGVAVGSSGDVYLAGWVTVVGEQSNVWMGRYMPDVSLRWWSDAYGNTEANLADEARAIAVSDDESRVAVVGFESVIFEDANVWVRMYQNNPTPASR